MEADAELRDPGTLHLDQPGIRRKGHCCCVLFPEQKHQGQVERKRAQRDPARQGAVLPVGEPCCQSAQKRYDDKQEKDHGVVAFLSVAPPWMGGVRGG